MNGAAAPGCSNEHLLSGSLAIGVIDFANVGSFAGAHANDQWNATSTDASTQVVYEGSTSADVGETYGSGPLTVTFSGNGVGIRGCISGSVGNGTVSCAVSLPSAVNFTIAATYSGSANVNGSTGALPQVVSKATSLTLLPSAPVLSGSSVTYSSPWSRRQVLVFS